MLALVVHWLVLLQPVPTPPKGPVPKATPAVKPEAKADDPIAELLDESVSHLIDDIVGQSGNPNTGDMKVERADVYTGIESLKSSGGERHAGTIKGWNFKIVEKPAGPNEFRYVRFAWKKEGGGSILLGFANDNNWSGKRYVSGAYATNGTGHKVNENVPEEWTVVTRDLFKDFGAFGLTGILLSSTGTGTAYFDHILLGRSTEDLDVATDAALGKAKVKVALSAIVRDSAWADLIGADVVKSSAAFRAFLPVMSEHVDYFAAHIPKKKNDPEKIARANSDIEKLNAEKFEVRIAAETELVALGEPAIPLLKAALNSEHPETQFRAKSALKKIGYSASDVLPSEARAARIVRLLERSKVKEAKSLLEKLSGGEYGPDYTADAAAALARWK